MVLHSSGRLVAVVCLCVLLLAGTASAGGVDGDGSVGATASIDGEASGDGNEIVVTDVDPSDAALGASTTISVPQGTDGAAGLPDANDTHTNTSAEASLADGEVGGSLDAETGDGDVDVDGTLSDENTTLEGEASVDGTGANVSVDAETNDTSISATVDGDVGDDTRVSATVDTSATESSTGDERTKRTAENWSGAPGDEGATGSQATAAATTPTPAEGRSDGGGDGDRSGSGTPTEPAAAGAVVVAGGAVAARRSVSLVVDGVAPLSTLRELLLAAIQWLRANFLRALVLLGYSRRDASDPLEHEVRADLYESIQATPGVHLSGLETTVDVSLSSVRHHLRVLEDESLVESASIRGKRRYFPPHAANTELVAALDEPATAAVLRELATVDAATVTTLAERLGRDPSTISHHLSRLEEDGLIERERQDQAVLSRLAEGPRRALAADDPGDIPASAD